MTQSILQTEGIILQVIKFGDYDQIATVFSQSFGVVKVLIKGGLATKRRAPVTPLTRIDLLYKSNKGEIHLCKEATPLERYHSDTLSYRQLEGCCQLAQAIRSSQLPEKPAPQLYGLFKTFLKAVAAFSNTDTWICSFWLKILRHEGLLDDFSLCSTCQRSLDYVYTSQGEGFCVEHAPPQALALMPEEARILQRLAFSRQLDELQGIGVSEALASKIKHLFCRSLDQK